MLFASFPAFILHGSLIFVLVLYLHFAQNLFAPSNFREAFILCDFFMVTIHNEATRTSATMERIEAGGMSKHPKNTEKAKLNSEAAVDRNPITRLFGWKAPKRRVGRLKTTKT